MLKKTLCLLLALALLSAPAAQAVKWDYPVSAHPAVDYADMLPVEDFDETALLSALKELEGLCARHSRDRDEGKTRRRVQALYQQILEEMDLLVTRANLSSIQYDASGGAPEEAAQYLELSAQQTRLYDRCCQALAVMAASPYAGILDEDAGEGAAYSLLGYRGLTEEEAALYQEEDRLIQEYDQIIEKGVPVQVEGTLWTAESLERAEVDAETYAAVGEALISARYQAAGELYLQLVRLRTDLARRAGYDNYVRLRGPLYPGLQPGRRGRPSGGGEALHPPPPAPAAGGVQPAGSPGPQRAKPDERRGGPGRYPALCGEL